MASRDRKRAFETIDLTETDEENKTRHKHLKHALPTPPSSSQSQPASQPSASGALKSRNAEPDDESSETDLRTLVESSQDFDDDSYENSELYGIVDSKVVGVRYYAGTANHGEIAVLRRDPTNKYDENAIRVDNVMGQQVGHIPRQVAAKLAPFMDAADLFVECNFTGHKGEFDIPCAIKLFGTSDSMGQFKLKQRMQNVRLPVNELAKAERARREEEKLREQERKAANKREKEERTRLLKEAASTAMGVRNGAGDFEVGDSKGWSNLNNETKEENNAEPTLEDILAESTSFNPRELGAVVDKYGAGEEALSKLPTAKQPAELSTTLLPYQQQGLAWMLDRESPVLPEPKSNDAVQLWKRDPKGGFKNLATGYTHKSPSLASGGILADDMGLGKTIQIISLLMADPKRSKQPTLIVSPLSVMSNWSSQIEAHVKPEHRPKILVYHGNGKQERKHLEQYDVVITTYQSMAMDVPFDLLSNPDGKCTRPGLYGIQWRRVVLDEGHIIRNPKAKVARAAYALKAQSRWILTGTPIVNNLRDLYSHVKFLRLTGGLEQHDVFSGALIRPLSAGDGSAGVLLQALISTICLRRMKDMNFINLRLPELSSHKYTVAFKPHERKKYDALEQEAKGMLLNYQTATNKKGENSYSYLLEVLLRLRQTCNHWKLCGDRIANVQAALAKHKTVDLNDATRKALQGLLQVSIDSQEDCPVCLESLHNPVITTCAHVFGGECIERVIERQHKCPMCRADLKDSKSLVEPTASLGEADDSLFDVDTTSSKLDALMNILRASKKKDGTKTIVFSQWTSFLDIIQLQLEKEGFTFCRLDGKMNATSRDAAMTSLAHDDTCTIMLASLTVCSVGLNLVAANQVVLSDSWWAPAIEDQAVDRVHRLGQTRPTTVFRLVMEDSIEERVLDIQQEKRKLMMMAFQEKSMKRGKESSAHLADIQRLLA